MNELNLGWAQVPHGADQQGQGLAQQGDTIDKLQAEVEEAKGAAATAATTVCRHPPGWCNRCRSTKGRGAASGKAQAA